MKTLLRVNCYAKHTYSIDIVRTDGRYICQYAWWYKHQDQANSALDRFVRDDPTYARYQPVARVCTA